MIGLGLSIGILKKLTRWLLPCNRYNVGWEPLTWEGDSHKFSKLPSKQEAGYNKAVQSNCQILPAGGI